jgi:hypothetical protein
LVTAPVRGLRPCDVERANSRVVFRVGHNGCG